MADSSSTLNIILQLKDQATQQLKGFQSTVESLQPQFKAMAAAGAAGFAAVTGVIYTSVEAAADAQAKMASMDATLNSLKGKAVDISGGLQQTVTSLKLTGGAAEQVRSSIISANLSILDQQNNLQKLGDKLAAGKISQTDYSLGVANAKQNINDLTIKISEYKDKLIETDSKQIPLIKTITLTADAVSRAREQFITASKSFVQLGFDDETAAQSMAILYQRTGNVSEAMKLTSLAADLARAKHLELDQATKLVSLALSGQGRALMQYGIIIKDAATPLEALGVLQEKVGGQATAFAGTFAGQMQALNKTTENLRESIGNAFLPVLTNLLQKITPIIEHVTAWVEKNPKLTETILIAVGALSGLMLVIGTIGVLLPAIILGFGLLTGPVGLATLAIGALIAVGIYLWQNWQSIKDNMGVLWDALKTNIMLVVNAIAVFIMAKWSILRDNIKLIWDSVKQATEDVWNGLKDFFSTVWDGIKAVFRAAYDYIMNLLQPIINAVNTVKGIASSIGSGIGSAVSGIGSFLGVHDAIITPQGQVIQTDPADYLIATKNPGALGGGGMTINIYGDVSGMDLVEKVKSALMRELRLDSKFSV